MAGFSKFDPNRPVDAPGGASTPAARRRAQVLKWIPRIVMLYTALGFGLIAYLLVKGWT